MIRRCLGDRTTHGLGFVLTGQLLNDGSVIHKALYGFRTANDHGRVPPDVLECGGNLTPMLTGTYSPKQRLLLSPQSIDLFQQGIDDRLQLAAHEAADGGGVS